MVDQETKAEDLGLSPVVEHSRLPRTSKEISITDYQADIFLRHCYRNVQDGTVHKINAIDELIDKTIDGRTIVGIYATEEDLDWLQQYDKAFEGVYADNMTLGGNIAAIDQQFYCWSQGDHMIKTAMIGSEGLGLTEISKVLYCLDGGVSSDRSLIQSLFDSGVNVEDAGNCMVYTHYKSTITVTSAYSGFTENAWIYTDECFLVPALWIAIAIMLISTLMLGKFFFDTTKAREKDFGVLPLIYLFILCFGGAMLSIVLPIIRICKENPTAMLNK